MRNVLFVLSLLVLLSCGETSTTDTNAQTTAELQQYKDLDAAEESTQKFIQEYIRAVNASDWKTTLPKYLPYDPEAFIAEHTAFRTSFPNYAATIKHLVVEGNRGVVWLNVTANYAKTYSLKSPDAAYGDDYLKGIEAENQALSWEEAWYFDVVDGKFGNEWDFLKDNHAVLKALNAAQK
ncbi:ester cyclase [Aggregatimonas sangjinii]|uniref:Ester cyclase n=1 Tax=Aggregatimonas sangjinii TaxID=2583587 RepID=A0A5B7SNX7_9FLAO|nr:ester cyclase [Aggregatimonas sangjinii]QCW99861.1 ester cyclase [Aggregatimonas sangjinii]